MIRFPHERCPVGGQTFVIGTPRELDESKGWPRGLKVVGGFCLSYAVLGRSLLKSLVCTK
jgi:hypothetical protein